jgi:hypothetical protein
MVPPLVEHQAAARAARIVVIDLHAQTAFQLDLKQGGIDFAVILDRRSRQPGSGPGHAVQSKMSLEESIVLLGFGKAMQQGRIEQTRQVLLGHDEPATVEGGWLQDAGSELGLRSMALQTSASIVAIEIPIDPATQETGLRQRSQVGGGSMQGRVANP